MRPRPDNVLAPSRPAVIVISSHVVRGGVGNRAAVFALETLGHPVWAVPTVILPWHPGHGRASRIVPDPEHFADLLSDLESAPWIGEVGAVMSGYLGEAAQTDAVAALVRVVKARNPDAVYLCDPVIGDSGGLYVPLPVAEAMRDRLMPLADIATPNRFELEWLAGMTVSDAASLLTAAARAGRPTTLVTSIPAKVGQTGNVLVTGGKALWAGHEAFDNPPNGPGDLTSALLLARLMAGSPPGEALALATASVFDVMRRAGARGSDELMLAADAALLSWPETLIDVHSLAASPVQSRR